METINLKSLANKVLQRNPKGNSMETDTKIKGNFEETFKDLWKLLENCPLTADEIRDQRPGIYGQIQKAIDVMDSAWLKEDLPEFSKAVKTIEDAYFKALREIYKG